MVNIRRFTRDAHKLRPYRPARVCVHNGRYSVCACICVYTDLYVLTCSTTSRSFRQPATVPQKEDSLSHVWTHVKGTLYCRSFIGSCARVRFDGGLPAFGLSSFKRLRRTSLMEIGMSSTNYLEAKRRLPEYIEEDYRFVNRETVERSHDSRRLSVV